jgi:hypothetical protein
MKRGLAFRALQFFPFSFQKVSIEEPAGGADIGL